MKTLGLLRWITGVVVFVAASVVFGQMASESRVAPVPSRLRARLGARLSTTEAPRIPHSSIGWLFVGTLLSWGVPANLNSLPSPVQSLGTWPAVVWNAGEPLP